MSNAVVILNIMAILILAAAVGIILRHSISTRRVSVFLCLFPILPIGQLLLLYSFSFNSWSLYWFLGLILSLSAHILLLIYTIFGEKRAAAEEELRETRLKIELEKSHYDAVERRREELDMMRRDFSKRLEDIAALIRSHEEEEANKKITELAQKIDLTWEKPYCSIPVINAVLAEKEKECTDADISLLVDLILPDVLAVEPMHLCSIFCNLLDNAIAACKEVSGGERPMIRLSSKIEGDYLFIKLTNPSNEPSKKRIPGRGYGTRILSDLAARYGGSYKGEYSSGIFTAVISLMN